MDKQINIFGNLLSPHNGIAVMGIVSVWATTQCENNNFRCWLLGFAVFCVFAAGVGDLLHVWLKQKKGGEC